MTTLSTAARSAIVSSYVKALDAHETSGSLVTQVCETATRYMKGEEIPEDDRKAIVSDIARAKGWTGKSAKSRKSECNVILKAYAKLGEAIKAFSKKAKRMQWHDAMKLARQLNKGATIQKAVSFAMKKNPGNTVSPEGRIAAGLKALVEAKPRKRDAVVKAAELLGITLKLKEE